MAQRDSTKKIQGYIDATNNEELILSPMFFRDYSCPPMCGGCCTKFSLDYFEGERWEKFKKTYPHLVHKFEKREVNGATVYTNIQKDNPDWQCEFLIKENGRCGIHESNPFSCEFELNKFLVKGKKTYLMNKLFGRGWNMMRIDGERGALCQMKPFNLKKYLRDIELLKELLDIVKQFGQKAPKLERVVKALDKIRTPLTNKIVFKDEEETNQQKFL
jgi:Fe-S-cluster containining protein